MTGIAPDTRETAPAVGFVSLGCPKALVDSERILTELRGEGYRIAGDYAAADLVVVNTCGFIDEAKAESLEAIGEALNENGRVLVTGCLGARAEEITAIHPRVLGVTGPHDYAGVVNAVHRHLPRPHDPFIDLLPPQGIRLTPGHYAYLKIAEGCNHKCSFCIIPAMRGKLASRPLGLVMREAETLVEAGVRELLVISQDTSAYGSDRRYPADWWHEQEWRTDLENLCRALGELDAWIRLHYVYPYPHVDRIIPLMAEGLILPYLDVPFQHGSPSVLRRMRRPAATENTLERIRAWRKVCPELAIRSTFIVGFPGETEDEFRELLDFLEQARLDRVGCFKYSPVEGAAANTLDAEPVPDPVKQERWERFMATQAEISKQRMRERVGRTLDVLVDEVDGARAIGRSYADAPEIDGVVHMAEAEGLQPGDLVEARIVDADEYDLYAAPAAQD